MSFTGVVEPEPGDLIAKLLVVLVGDLVEPPEASVLVVVPRVVAAVPAQVRRQAPHGEDVGDQERFRTIL